MENYQRIISDTIRPKIFMLNDREPSTQLLSCPLAHLPLEILSNNSSGQWQIRKKKPTILTRITLKVINAGDWSKPPSSYIHLADFRRSNIDMAIRDMKCFQCQFRWLISFRHAIKQSLTWLQNYQSPVP